MMIQSAMTLFLSLVILLGISLPAQAESITCPDTGRRLTRTEAGRASGEVYLTDINEQKYHQTVCQYGKDNRIVLHWLAREPVQDRTRAAGTCRWMRERAGGQPFRTDVRKAGASVYSNTHLVSARLYLSKREMAPRRRQAWVNHAHDLVRGKMDEALTCEDVLGESAPLEASREPEVVAPAIPPAPQEVPESTPTPPSEETDAEIDDILERLRGGRE